MTTVAGRTNKPDRSKEQIVENAVNPLSPASDIGVQEHKMYKQAPVITLANTHNPLTPVPSASVENTVKVAKTIESGKVDLGPIASSDSPTLVGNPEVPLKEDGK